jgi:alkanesulfonate monooxygenase SsuD/methylene tetrahydromethanopterin reductase-like flavin-dependent oxidoreductase (luciferase family)
MVSLSLRYDLRMPAFGAASHVELYRAALEQAAWADGHGFDTVHLSEHHGTDDGYCPSPLVFAAAIAGRTERIRIECVIPLSLHDPLRIAEDTAVLDIISNGRLDLMIVAGYVASEFDMFGRDLGDRPALIEDSVGVLRSAWQGGQFEYGGRLVQVTPLPVQRGGPRLVFGGSTPASARRAARLADGYSPTDPALRDAYVRASHAAGREPGPAPRPSRSGFVFVSHDPERDWARIAPYALHESNTYAALLAAAGINGPFETAADAGALRASGRYAVVTPGQCVDLLAGVESWMLHPLMGGLPPHLSWQSLEIIAAEVLPVLRSQRS